MSLFCCLLVTSSETSNGSALEAIARACSPRVERAGTDAVVFDVSGLERVLGPPTAIAEAVRRMSAEQGRLGSVRLAVAGTQTTAWLLAHAGGAASGQGKGAPPEITIVPAGREATALAELPLDVLRALPDSTPSLSPRQRNPLRVSQTDNLAILRRWGLRTLGDLARLSEADVRTRLGESGAQLHRAARGADAGPLVPTPAPARFVERLELEWPIEGLEPLSFVLARLCDALAAALERADRGAVTALTRLRLVTRATHERRLQWPAPIRDARVLRTLILLDLESHPPDAAIDVIELDLGVTPARIVQGSLLARSLPSAEDLATLVARLGALIGDTRVGTPVLLDTHDERAVAMQTFRPPSDPADGRRRRADRPHESRAATDPAVPALAGRPLRPCLRRFHLPVAATVVLDRHAPVHVTPAARGLPGGRIVARAGPWRSSGHWWASPHSRASGESWDRDEWDVEVAPAGCVYRLARDRQTGGWVVHGVLD